MNIDNLQKAQKKMKGAARTDAFAQQFDSDDERQDYEVFVGSYKLQTKMNKEVKLLYDKLVTENVKPFKGFNKFEKREFKTIEVNEGGNYEGYVTESKDMRDGQGFVLWADGSIYDGWWKDDKPHGNGIKVFINGDAYVGSFRAGKMSGKGTYYKADNSKYEGEWQDNLQNGNGTQTWSDNHSYEGQWKEGTIHNLYHFSFL